MRAQTSVAIERGGVLRELRCEPPVTVRRIHGEAGVCALCQVGTAAGPLPGDDLLLRLAIGTGASASLVAAGATIALGPARDPARVAPRPQQPSILRTEAAIGADARLVAAPPPLVVTGGAIVEASVSICLASGAAVRWRELIVLGRTGEPGGSLRLRWDVTSEGLPLLRQEIDLADPVLTGWPAMLHNARVLASTLVVGPQIQARTVVASPTAVVHRLSEHAALITVLGLDAGAVELQAADLADSIGG